jgi:uncharacterized protein
LNKDHPDFSGTETFIITLLEEKLSPFLSYHNTAHTLDVLNVALKIAEVEEIPPGQVKLLRIAVLFHDAGFIYTYRDHEERSCDMVREYLPGYNFSQQQIDCICEMIMATKIPQSPKSVLDRIIGDADLDYLGRNDVFTIAEKLFEEMKYFNLLPNEKDWISFQVKFLKGHHYSTRYSTLHRAPNKDIYLKGLTEKLGH